MANVRQITPEKVYEMIQRGDNVDILDVREHNEYSLSHVANSRHIPLADLQARIAELDPARPLMALCRSGRRSETAAQQLLSKGFDVHNIEGGILAWTAAALPVEKGD